MCVYSPPFEMGESLFMLSHFNFNEEVNILDHFVILKVNSLVYFLLDFFQVYILYIAEIKILYSFMPLFFFQIESG